MSAKIERFFKKHHFTHRDVKYILREDGKTAIYLLDGRIVYTYNTIKEIKTVLPEDDFLYPNKGIVLSAAQIAGVHDGKYETMDGRTFKYRVHSSQQHDRKLLLLGMHIEQVHEAAAQREDDPYQFTLYDNMPVAVAVVECVFDEGQMRHYVRYVNKALLTQQSTTYDNVINKSCYEVIPNIDKKLFATLADVAMNGTSRSLSAVLKDDDAPTTVHCFQPLDGFCACILTKETE